MTLAENAELDDLLAQLPTLNRGELFALAGAHSGEDPAREAAWNTVREVVVAEGAEDELDWVRSEVAAWATQTGMIADQLIGSGMSDEPMTNARLAAAPAVLDAAVAYLLGDRLAEPDRAALLRPWESVFTE